jgi:hypothetical protein
MKNKTVEERSRQQNWQLIKRAEGICPGCGDEKLDINQRTGKPYKLGPICRKKWNELQKQLMRERRKAGIADY